MHSQCITRRFLARTTLEDAGEHKYRHGRYTPNKEEKDTPPNDKWSPGQQRCQLE